MMWNHPSFKWSLPLAFGLSLCSAVPAFAGAAFRLDPPRMTFTPGGSGATRSFRILSTGDQPVAVEIRMTKRVVGLDGAETQPSAEADFAVYPAQILLKPGETQTVRVTWLGDPQPPQELSYRIIAEQLPINLPVIKQEQNGLQVDVKALYVYVGSVYITPRGVAPKVVVEQAMCQQGPGDRRDLALTLANEGTVHTYLTNLSLNLTAAGSNTIHLTPDQLKGIDGENMLAGSKRQFMLPCPAGFPTGPVSVKFEFLPNQ